MDFGLKKSDFQKRSKIHSKHVRLSKNVFRGPESRLGPLGTIQDALEVILEKKIFWIFFHFFYVFYKGIWPIFEGSQRKKS